MPRPPLVPALLAMTGLQALVSLALFAPGVLAPQLGIEAGKAGLFATAVFVVGVASSLHGGAVVARLGSFGVAILCAVIVVAAMTASMVAAALASVALLVVAGAVLGIALGPETPASSALLARLTRPEQRPLVFSMRQTGNQIGGVFGSVALPTIALWEPRAGFGVIVLLALVALVAFAVLRPRYDAPIAATATPLGVRAALQLLRESAPLRALALISMPYSAMQLTLNVFFVTFAVTGLDLTPVDAGILLAIAQAAGLLGRLTWGVVATHLIAAGRLLVLLGLAMAACAVTLAFATPAWSFAALAALVFAFGLTASGWNGVFLAEIARLAPEGRVSEATGAVQTASYAGLVLGPLLVAAIVQLASLAIGFAVIAGLTLLSLPPLIRAGAIPRRAA